jgi:hypothetical protein
MWFKKLFAGAAAALLLAGLAGCGSPGHHTTSASAAAGQSGSVHQQALAIWQEFARCARSHGTPSFPDLDVDDHGEPHPHSGMPAQQFKQLVLQVRSACGAILRRLPASAQGNATHFTAADVQHLRQFAACVRQHGVPNWPDPKPDGTFPLRDTPLGHGSKSPAIIAAFDACQHYWPGRIVAS